VRRNLFSLAYILLIAPSGFASNDPQNLASQVRATFDLYCAECHDAGRGVRKGGFGTILDLRALASDSDLVVRSQPAQSKLYQMVLSDQMPPQRPPLSSENKAVIWRWIEAGAPADRAEESPTPAVGPTVGGSSLPAAAPPQRFIVRLVKWMGRFHPVAVHFPIGLLLAAFLAEILGILSGRSWFFGAARYCIAVGALGALAAASLGWATAGWPDADTSLLAAHRSLGTATAIWAVLVFALSEWSHRAETRQRVRLRRFVLFVGAVLVAITGHFGGMVVYGSRYFKW
jgi:uncharacterized membrane protein/mono/diheme cytochrome c family protein